MIIGQTVFGGTFYSPWFPRQGDSGVFTAESINSLGTLTFKIQTKNKDQADTAAAYASAASSNIFGTVSTGSFLGTVMGTMLLELVRFEYTISSSTNNWVHFRVLPPAWRTNGA
jgi:hypothetical protein